MGLIEASMLRKEATYVFAGSLPNIEAMHAMQAMHIIEATYVFAGSLPNPMRY